MWLSWLQIFCFCLITSFITGCIAIPVPLLPGDGIYEVETDVEQLIESNATIQQVYRLLQDSAHPRLLVDKSPTYAFNLETLKWAEYLFDRPKYIHLVRHPLSVIDSFVRTRMERLLGSESEDSSRLGEQVWSETNANIIDFFECIDSSRHYRVCYEELVQNRDTH